MENCIYCTNHAKRESLMIKICELPNSIVYFSRDQFYLGRCVVACKGHKTEYFQLTPEENAGFFAEMTKVSKAIATIYHSDKINFLTHGDNMKHAHMHICPKWEGTSTWGKAFCDHEPVFLTDEEYEVAVARLKEEILKDEDE